MKIKRQEFQVDAILTGDWHLRDTQPSCWAEDFWAFQMGTLNAISELQRLHKCPVINSGDLFHHWKPPPVLTALAIQHVPDRMIGICGNHDLPQHQIENYHKSGIAVLEAAGVMEVLHDHKGHWGLDHDFEECVFIKDRKIAVWHVMHYHKTPPWPGAVGYSSEELLDLCEEHDIDLLLTGHYHRTVMESRNGRVVFNAGAITQQASDQADHYPCVGLWDAKQNKIKLHYLPNGQRFISNDATESKKEKASRYNAFIERVGNLECPDLDFEENLRIFFRDNKTEKSVQNLIMDCLHKGDA